MRAHIGFLPTISSNEVDRLEAVQISTSEDLWGIISGSDDGFESLVRKTGISPLRLTELLEGDLRQFVVSQAGRWTTRHWLDLATSVAILVVLILLGRASRDVF